MRTTGALPTRKIKASALLAVAALVLPACGSANQDAIEASGLSCPPDADCYDEPRPVGPGSELTVEAGDLWFRYEGVRSDQEQLTLQGVEGDLALTLINAGAAEHNFRIDEAVADSVQGKKVTALAGETDAGTLPLFAGTYTFYCDIPGHRPAGMEGQIEILTAAEAEEAGSAEAEEGAADEDAETDTADEDAETDTADEDAATES